MPLQTNWEYFMNLLILNWFEANTFPQRVRIAYPFVHFKSVDVTLRSKTFSAKRWLHHFSGNNCLLVAEQ